MKQLYVICALSMTLISAAPGQPETRIFDAYVGRYIVTPNFIVEITRDGDHLYAQATGRARFEIFLESDGEFFAKTASIRISFRTGNEGKATEIVLHQNGRDTPAKKMAGDPPKERTGIALDPKILQAYTGRYRMPTPQKSFNRDRGAVMTVTLDEGGHLFTQMTGKPRIEILAENQHDFFPKGSDARLTFNTDAQGKAIECVVHEGVGSNTFKRIGPAAESLRPKLAEIDSLVAADFARHPIGSLTIGVVFGNQLLWTKSYGNAEMEKQIPADQDTIYRIGSITKMFTGVMLEQLVDAGKVHLSDPVEKYFPEINMVQGKDGFPDAPPTTLVQLATHTSGLGREPSDTETYVHGPVSEWERTLIAALPHTEYEFEPGTHYSYSNIGFAILGAALARASGESYVEYVDKHIFSPLGMSHSAMEFRPEMLPHLAKGYDARSSAETSQREHEGRGYKLPNGAIYTTVGDLARFASFLMGEGPASVLKTASLERFLTQTAVQTNADFSSGYGLGFMVTRRDNRTYLGHSGGVAGYSAGLEIDRQGDVGVIVLASTQASAAGLAMRLLDVLSK